MKFTHMAVGMTPLVSFVLEWRPDDFGVRLTILESGDRFTNEGLVVGSDTVTGQPRGEDLTWAVIDLVTSHHVRSWESAEVWMSARFGVIDWFAPVDMPGKVRKDFEELVGAPQWV